MASSEIGAAEPGTFKTATAGAADQVSAPSMNSRQWRLVNFAVRKACRWELDPADPRTVILTRSGSTRQMCLYSSGATGSGMKVAIVDGSLPAAEGLRWISQRAAWQMLSHDAL